MPLFLVWLVLLPVLSVIWLAAAYLTMFRRTNDVQWRRTALIFLLQGSMLLMGFGSNIRFTIGRPRFSLLVYCIYCVVILISLFRPRRVPEVSYRIGDILLFRRPRPMDAAEAARLPYKNYLGRGGLLFASATFVFVVVGSGVIMLLPCAWLDRAFGLSGCRAVVTPDSPPNAMAFSPDGTTLATTSYHSEPQLWRLSDQTEIRTLQAPTIPSDISAIAFTPDGTTVAVCAPDEGIYLWRVADGALVRTIEFPDSFSSLCQLGFSSDSKKVGTTINADTFMFWQISTGAALGSIPPEQIGVTPNIGVMIPGGPAIAPGRFVPLRADAALDPALVEPLPDTALISFIDSNDTLITQRYRDGVVVARTTIPNVRMYDSAFAPAGDRVFATVTDIAHDIDKMQVLSVPDAGVIRDFPLSRIRTDTPAFAHDGRTLALEVGYRNISVWDVSP